MINKQSKSEAGLEETINVGQATYISLGQSKFPHKKVSEFNELGVISKSQGEWKSLQTQDLCDLI